ncbi:DNA double-strand break repair nuclease NurA [Methanothermococcus sp. SCGC AD-155-E23]|nr:DNA double-strand break repair nuclease NurA [Methanothermococcus sp. SCGC AD-155-E23]
MKYFYILSKKEEISKLIERINREIDYKKQILNDCWISSNFQGNGADYTFGGGDGSFNRIDYINLCLYLVGSVSYTNKVGERLEDSISFWEPGIVLPYRYVEYRLKLYMINMELKTALWNLENRDIDYYLFDGSLYSLIIQTHTYGGRINGEIKEDYGEILDYYRNYKKEIKDEIYQDLADNRLTPVTSTVRNAEDEKLRIILEQVEYIVLLREIVEKYRDKFIGVSKTSKMSIYFKRYNDNGNSLFKTLPDIGIFSSAEGTGYSKPINLADRKEVDYNIYYSIHYLKRFHLHIPELYYQFVRLDSKGGVLNITSFKKLEEKFFANLKDISVGGYPYILRRSHEDVKISDKDMEICARLLKLYDSRDRDMVI